MDDDEHLEKLVEERFGKFNYHKIMKEVFDSIKLKDDNPDIRKRVNNIIDACLDKEAYEIYQQLDFIMIDEVFDRRNEVNNFRIGYKLGRLETTTDNEFKLKLISDLKELKCDIEEIAEHTDISLEEIENISENI